MRKQDDFRDDLLSYGMFRYLQEIKQLKKTVCNIVVMISWCPVGWRAIFLTGGGAVVIIFLLHGVGL